MDKLEELYYCETSGALDCGTTNTGAPSFDHLMANKPYWIKNAVETKQKQLLIADWRALNWSPERCDTAITTLHQCMKQGFKVFLWQQGTIKQLKQNKLNQLRELSVRSKITFATQHEIERVMAAQSMAATKVQILDDYYMDRLLWPNNPPTERVLFINDLTVYETEYSNNHRENTEDHYNGMITYLTENSAHHCEPLIQTEFNNEPPIVLLYINKKFPNIKVNKDYKTLTVTSDHIFSPNKTALLINSKAETEFPKESITFDLVKDSQQLETLTIDVEESFDLTKVIITLAASQRGESGSDFVNNLVPLLDNATKLKHINIEYQVPIVILKRIKSK